MHDLEIKSEFNYKNEINDIDFSDIPVKQEIEDDHNDYENYTLENDIISEALSLKVELNEDDEDENYIPKIKKPRTKKAKAIHKCTQCDKRFVTVAQLEKHVKCKHETVKNFACDTCGKKYRWGKIWKWSYKIGSQ